MLDVLDTIISTSAFSIGSPSSLELDTISRILYWTDVKNNRIGFLHIDDRSILPQFLDTVGHFPDGLSLDYVTKRIYWDAMK